MVPSMLSVGFFSTVGVAGWCCCPCRSRFLARIHPVVAMGALVVGRGMAGGQRKREM